MPSGGKRDGAGRKPKLSPADQHVVSDSCNRLYQLIWLERYRLVTAKAMPRFSAFMKEFVDKTAKSYSQECFDEAVKTGSPLPPRVLYDGEREDELFDAEIAVKYDAGLFPRNMDSLSDTEKAALIDAEDKRSGIYWTFTPSIQSIEAEVKHRARRALMERGIDVSEKTIGRIWKRDHRSEY